MKIAISADGPDLEAKVSYRFGISQYLIVIDLATMDVEAMTNPDAIHQRGAGMQMVALAVSKKVKKVLTGYCSPTAEGYLSARGIEVITGVVGTVAEVSEHIKRKSLQEDKDLVRGFALTWAKIDKVGFVKALGRSAHQFINMLPILVSVVLLIGLFNAFLSKELVSSIFSGNKAIDTLLGACLGSILTGNPINSYIIGGELLGYGVSLLAVTAFIIAWVNVGLVQLPAEAVALGKKFALARNAISFFLSIIIAIITVLILLTIAG